MAEHPRRVLPKLLLPSVNLVRVKLVAPGQISPRRLLPNRLQSDLRLQGRVFFVIIRSVYQTKRPISNLAPGPQNRVHFSVERQSG